MASESEIYRSQLKAHHNRQPRHREDLDALHSKLRDDVKKDSPYRLSEKEFSKFQGLDACERTCTGLQGMPQGIYCYHITNAWKLIRNTYGLERRVLQEKDSTKAFQSLTRAYAEVEPDWLPLKRFIGGVYSGRRGVTWWTSLEL